MTWLTSLFAFGSKWWPILSFIISLASGIHATSSHAEAKSGAVSMSSQAVNVAGAGTLSAVALVVGACGVVSNHKNAELAPAKAPQGVNNVLHQESILHSAMVEDSETTQEELDDLNTLVKRRKSKKDDPNSATAAGKPALQVAGGAR